MQRVSDHLYVETAYHWANVGAAVTKQGIVLIDCPVRPSQSRHWQDALRQLGAGDIRYLNGTRLPRRSHHRHQLRRRRLRAGDGAARLCRTREASPQRAREPQALLRHAGRHGLPEEAEQVANAVVPRPGLLRRSHDPPPRAADVRDLPKRRPHAGCTCVLVPEERVLFSSDVMINEPGAGMRDANLTGWIAALEWMETLPIDHVVPGPRRSLHRRRGEALQARVHRDPADHARRDPRGNREDRGSRRSPLREVLLGRHVPRPVLDRGPADDVSAKAWRNSTTTPSPSWASRPETRHTLEYRECKSMNGGSAGSSS